jgi:hypothetical protein
VALAPAHTLTRTHAPHPPPPPGYLTASRHAEVPSQLTVLGTSFPRAGTLSSQGSHALPGTLLNFNTMEGFTKTDLKGHMQQVRML